MRLLHGFVAISLLLAGGCKSTSKPGSAETSPAATDSSPAGQTAENQPAPAQAEQTGPDDGAGIDTGPDDSGTAPAAGGTHVATGKQGAVTSAEANASRIGREILESGGNAVDAAVAVGLALSVTHPSAGNIGGGGFMVIRNADGTSTAIDYREVAPSQSTANMYLDKRGEPTVDSRKGPRAAGIPGDVAGFAYAHKKYGSLPWKDLVAPAVALAKDGHTLDSFHRDDLNWMIGFLGEYRETVAKRKGKTAAALGKALAATENIFRDKDGKRKVGQVWKQPDLAATLQLIADNGADGFYKGPLAKRMVKEVRAMGGIWTVKDLANYAVVERTPIVFDYRGHQIITMPPPSAGGIALRQIFAANEILGLHKMEWWSVDRLHLFTEALRRIYADRSQLIGDPNFVNVPSKTLLDLGYIKKRMADIDKGKATPSSQIRAGVELVEKPQTTHYSVVDKSGMAVANTYTLNGGFGAKVAIPGTGVILNNEMDDFTAKPGAANMFGLVQGAQNAIAPGKRMVSSMTPTIVAKGGKLRAVCGSPGGPTITTITAQVLLQVIDLGTPIDRAIANARIHHQWLPDQIFFEESLDKKMQAGLKKRGHTLQSRGRMGHTNCISVDPKTGTMRAVADSGRRGGRAEAY